MGHYHDLLTLAEKQINLQVTSLHQYHIKHKKNDNTINVLILHEQQWNHYKGANFH